MNEMTPTQELFELTHGKRFGVRADRSKGVTYRQARVISQRWEDRTDDIEVYYTGVEVPLAKMYGEAGLGEPEFFRNQDGNEQGRFPHCPCSCVNLAHHLVFANQGEDYDGDFDAMTTGSVTATQAVIDGAQRFWIQRCRKIRDASLLPNEEIVKHPRNFQLLLEVKRELATTQPTHQIVGPAPTR